MRVGFLGPLGTISQEVAESAFVGFELLPLSSLTDVVEAVADQRCQFAVAPYHNTHELAIHEVRRAIGRLCGRVFFARMHSHAVTHTLFSCGEVGGLAELWSKDVVFSQVSRWIESHASGAKLKFFQSTAQAVAAAAEAQNPAVGAIGSRLAERYYPGIPLLCSGIQNPGNFTTFAVLTNLRSEVPLSGRLMLASSTITPRDEGVLLQIMRRHRFRLASAEVTDRQGPNDAPVTFFEIDSDPTFTDSSPALDARQAFLTEVSERLHNISFVGGFTGPSLAKLFFRCEH